MVYTYPDENGNLVQGDAQGFWNALNSALKNGAPEKKAMASGSFTGQEAMIKLNKVLGIKTPESKQQQAIRNMVVEEIGNALHAGQASQANHDASSDGWNDGYSYVDVDGHLHQILSTKESQLFQHYSSQVNHEQAPRVVYSNNGFTVSQRSPK